MARSCALAALDLTGRQLIGLIGFEDPGTACRDGRRTSVPSTQLQKPWEHLTPCLAPAVAGLRSRGAPVGSGRPELATAPPWPTSDSRRRPPPALCVCGGMEGRRACPQLRWLGDRPPVGSWGEATVSLARLRGRRSIRPGSSCPDTQRVVPLRVTPLCADPLPCSGSTRLKVHLYW